MAQGAFLLGETPPAADRVICGDGQTLALRLVDESGRPVRGGASRLQSSLPGVVSLVPHPSGADAVYFSCGARGTSRVFATVGRVEASIVVDSLGPIWSSGGD